MKNVILIIGAISVLLSCSNIQIDTIYKGYSMKGKHTRGIDASKDLIVVSGSKGSFATFNNLKSKFNDYDWVTGMEDFRDVHINPDGSILFLNSGVQGQIWQVKNGKQSLVYSQDNLFLDGFDFKDSIGFAYGDPINDSTFVVLKTTNYGQTWQPISSKKLPLIIKDEAGFAASGTGIQMVDEQSVYIATGVGEKSRIMRSFDLGETWDVIETPMKSGEHYGIYSMHFNSISEGFVIGGSYKDSAYHDKICYYTQDKGKNWENKSKGLPGYMSCIDANENMTLVVTTGRLGTYYSVNKGEKWQLLTKMPYYSCRVTDSQIVLAGRFGTFELLNYTLKK